MILERRDFLKLLGGATGAVALGSCGRFLVPDRLVELALRGAGVESRRNTICGLCESGCGLTVRQVDGLPVGLKGNARHPLNRGGLCPVGQGGLEVLYAANRLQEPLRRRSQGGFEPASWDQALGEIADRTSGLVAAGRGDRIAMLSGASGQLFRDLAERFVTALGSASLAHRRDPDVLPFRLSQGIDRVPGFDLAHADLVISFGLDLYEDGTAPVHAIHGLVGSRPVEDRAELIYVGSRLSTTATRAGERIAIFPGAHTAAALGIAHVLVREGRYDGRFVAERCFGFDDWVDDEGNERLGFRRLLLERYYPDRAALLAGCDPGKIIRVARRLARASAPVALYGGEAAGDASATWTGLAVQALNALLGAFDRPGGVVLPPPIPFSPLAPVAGKTPRRSLFEAGGSTSLGLDPVEALAAADDVEVLFVVDDNPVFESPAGDHLLEALERIPLVVSLASFLDETASAADYVLPTSLFFETWQESTTPPGVAFSVLGVSQPVVEPFFDTRHPGDVLLGLASRFGGDVAAALPWSGYRAYLEQRLGGLLTSGQGSVISGSFEESWIHFLEERGWRFLERAGAGAFWNDLTVAGGWWNPVRSREDWERLLPTSTGRFEFFSLELERRLRQRGAAGAGEPGGAEALQRGIEAIGLSARGDEACLPHFEPAEAGADGELRMVPFRPITARGALGVTSPMVLEMFGYPALSGWETWVELAPATAHRLHLEDGDRVALESARGGFEAVVHVEPGATPGVAHVPVGLGRRGLGGPADGIGANPLAYATVARDPLSGRLATTATRVRLELRQRRRRGGPRPLSGGHG